MTTLNRNELRQELKAYREMGYTLQIKLTASTEEMEQEYSRIYAMDNVPVADGYDYGDMTLEEIEEAGVTITGTDTGKYINQEVKSTLIDEMYQANGTVSTYHLDYCLPNDETELAYTFTANAYGIEQARATIRKERPGLMYLGCKRVEPIETGKVVDIGCNTKHIPSNIITVPNGEKFTVESVLQTLQMGGYSAWRHDENMVMIDTLPGFIVVHDTYLIFSSEALVNSGIGKMLQVAGYCLKDKAWNRDVDESVDALLEAGKHYRKLPIMNLVFLINQYKAFGRICQFLLAFNLEAIVNNSVVTISFDQDADIVDTRVMMENLEHEFALEDIGFKRSEIKDILEISGFTSKLKDLEKKWRREEFIYGLEQQGLSVREIMKNLRKYDAGQ